MKRVLKIIGILLVLLIGFGALRSCDFGPEPLRPDLDLPLAPQMADPSSAPMDLNFPEVNPMAADGVNPMPHGNSAQQDSTPIPGPMDVTRRLQDHEIVHTFMGPGHFGIFTSAPMPMEGGSFGQMALTESSSSMKRAMILLIT